MNLSLLKMSDGSDIMVTVLDSENSNTLFVEKVRRVMFRQDEQTKQIGVAFPPWSEVAGDNDMEINRQHIVMTVNNLPKALEDAYLSNTSGIALA